MKHYSEREHYNYHKIVRYFEPKTNIKNIKKQKYYQYYRHGGYIDYITRKNACVKNSSTQKEFEELLDLEKKIKNYFKFDEDNLKEKEELEYLYALKKTKYDKKGENTGLWGKNGVLSTEEEQKLRKTLSNLSLEQKQWDSVLSFDADFAVQNEICSPKDLNIIFNNNIKKYLKANDFDIDYTDWFYSFHANTNNPHIHFMFYEKEAKFKNTEGKKVFKQNGKMKLETILEFSFNIAIDIQKKSLKTKEVLANERNFFKSLKLGFNKYQKDEATEKGLEGLEKIFLMKEKINLQKQENLSKNLFNKSLAPKQIEKNALVIESMADIKQKHIDEYITKNYSLEDIYYFQSKIIKKELVELYLSGLEYKINENALMDIRNSLNNETPELNNFSKKDLINAEGFYTQIFNKINMIIIDQKWNYESIVLEKAIKFLNQRNEIESSSDKKIQKYKENNKNIFEKNDKYEDGLKNLILSKNTKLIKLDKSIGFQLTQKDLEKVIENTFNKTKYYNDKIELQFSKLTLNEKDNFNKDKKVLLLEAEEVKNVLLLEKIQDQAIKVKKSINFDFNKNKNFKIFENILKNKDITETEILNLKNKYNKTEIINFKEYILKNKLALNQTLQKESNISERNTVKDWEEIKKFLKPNDWKKIIKNTHEEIYKWRVENNIINLNITFQSLNSIYQKDKIIKTIDKLVALNPKTEKEFLEIKLMAKKTGKIEYETYIKTIKPYTSNNKLKFNENKENFLNEKQIKKLNKLVLPDDPYIITFTEEELKKGKIVKEEFVKQLFINKNLYGNNSPYERAGNSLLFNTKTPFETDYNNKLKNTNKTESIKRFKNNNKTIVLNNLISWDRESFQKELDKSLKHYLNNIERYKKEIQIKELMQEYVK